ncbi:MAG: peptide chain release factor-like protein [Myxococcales bacterium]|nr:peptide chain release factor-like protein [Myxococcales bacterium]
MVAESTVEYVRAGGPGGQHRNKRETGIRLVHAPSGLIIMATERRSRAQNESLAFERLRERLADLNYVPEARIPTRTPRRAKAARMDDKRRVGEKKRGRSRPRPGGDDG